MSSTDTSLLATSALAVQRQVHLGLDAAGPQRPAQRGDRLIIGRLFLGDIHLEGIV